MIPHSNAAFPRVSSWKMKRCAALAENSLEEFAVGVRSIAKRRAVARMPTLVRKI